MAWPLLDPIADQFLNGFDSHVLRVQIAATGIRRIEDLMHVERSLEADEGQEAGYGRQRGYSTQIPFSEEEGPEKEASRIADQILAKLGPELRQSRDPKRRPSTPGPQRVRSVERETSPSVSKDTSKHKGIDKTAERTRGRSSSTNRSRSRNREGPPQCYKYKGFGHFMRDCPSGDFNAVGPNGLPIKKREASQERQKPKDGPVADQPLN